jgi:predicted DNA repair protein MutK
MAGGSLLTLFDDVTTLLDDVALLTKTTTQKTAGVLGDDLALNAEQVSGVRAERELPVVWAVAKGSLKNKAILVPGAMLISAIAPWAITPILMIGGAYLCLEGFEKIAHKYLDHSADETADAEEARAAAGKSPAELERIKVKGAIRTDLILSMEIMAIALGAVAGASLLNQFLVLTAVALLVTVGVYGLVALIVRMDDVGFYLEKKPSQMAKAVGRKIIQAAPILMKLLTIIGTCAMFLVGAGIILHGVPVLSDLKHSIEHAVEAIPVVKLITPVIIDGVAGVLIGALVMAGVSLVEKVRGLFTKTAQ